MNKKKLISIVIPVFNEEETIPILYKRLRTVIETLSDKYRFEILFTNNCSTDSTLDILKKLREEDPNINVITFSRNFGHEASVKAGLECAKGSAIITMDFDGEDPPELISQLVDSWENGYDIVYGERSPGTLKYFRKAYYRVLKLLSDQDIILNYADLGLITRNVRDAMIQNRSTHVFNRAEIAYTGFKRKPIPYQREPRVRKGGESYNFYQIIKYAISGILSSSTLPLRLTAYVGFPLIILDLILLMFRDLFILTLINSIYMILFMISISIYLTRIHKDVIARPIYIIDWSNSTIEQA